MPKHITALIVTTTLGAIAAVYGGIADSGAFLAVGLTAAFLSLIFIPVLYQRAMKRRRLFNRQDALLYWHYTENEAACIAAQEAAKTRRTSVSMSILACVCLLIIFTPFVVITESPDTRQLILCIGIAAVLLPFLSVCIAPAYTALLIKRVPSMTIIGRDYILVNNRYMGINDRAELTLKSAVVKTGNDGEDKLFLTYTFRMKHGHIINFTVDVPIPWGRTDEAIRFAENTAAIS